MNFCSLVSTYEMCVVSEFLYLFINFINSSFIYLFIYLFVRSFTHSFTHCSEGILFRTTVSKPAHLTNPRYILSSLLLISALENYSTLAHRMLLMNV